MSSIFAPTSKLTILLAFAASGALVPLASWPSSSASKRHESFLQAAEPPEPVCELTHAEGRVTGPLLFSPNGRYVIAVGWIWYSKDCVINFWDIDTRKHVRTVS